MRSFALDRVRFRDVLVFTARDNDLSSRNSYEDINWHMIDLRQIDLFNNDWNY